jgi:hypothetical protein|uniref:Uncharacterized protein n=1 Tax=Picea glauca TaxID=3330 RepID=A0A101LYN1_PICGL|nr:hypothetical protein ABT39_MTgene5917 [Picea glauca]QHR92050.1 hypothetical protein Q903MT_gene6086 [Picea sitchensis]
MIVRDPPRDVSNLPVSVSRSFDLSPPLWPFIYILGELPSVFVLNKPILSIY